jgi:2-phosphosulfolactate phosphatase
MTLSPDIMLAPFNSPHDLRVEVIHVTGLDGARHARGIAVVIDVLRSFTVSAYALAGGARECRLVTATDEAVAMAAGIRGALLSAEENGLPIHGIAISNSPTQIKAADLKGRVLVQRSSAGIQVAAAIAEGIDIFAASLVVARATVQACLLRVPTPTHLTLIASADHPEDHACARYMEAIIRGDELDELDAEQLLQPLRDSERYARLLSGATPGFPPTDLELALTADLFHFAMPAQREAGYLKLTRADQPEQPNHTNTNG